MLLGRFFFTSPKKTLHRCRWLIVVQRDPYSVSASRLPSSEEPQSKEDVDPFRLVEEELSAVGKRLRSMVGAEVPKLASAAEYFFKIGAEGKRFRPTVLLLMATAVDVPPVSDPPEILRPRQQLVAEITEMIHAASLLHDDVLDDADSRRGINSLNSIMGNKMAVLAGDFLLSRACVALASLNDTRVVYLLAKAVEHLVTGETMQMNSDRCCSMDHYMQKTYYKTASLISNSCRAVSLLAGHATDVSDLASDYGKNLGIAYQLIDDLLDFTGTTASLGKDAHSDIRHGVVTAPLLFAVEEFPHLRPLIHRRFRDSADVDIALDCVGRSSGLNRTRELAEKHARLAVAAIDSFPRTDSEIIRRFRCALVDLTDKVISRTS